MTTTLHRAITALTLLAASVFTAGTALAETTVTYLINDGLGSPIAAMNEQGAVVWRKDYQPYGSEYSQDPAATGERIGYTGHVHDTSTGLTYMGARYYDPVIGRFMAADPVGFDESNPMSFSRYGYANSNPYRYVDPDGREATAEELVGQLRSGSYSDQIGNRASKIADGMSVAGDALVVVGTVGPSAKVKAVGPIRKYFNKLLGRSADNVASSVIKDSRARKIFGNRNGHLPDTSQNRKLLQDVANDTKTTLGPDKHGNIWSAKSLDDGTQLWTQTRNGEIINGGLNKTPRIYNSETGLSVTTRPNWK